MTDFKNMDKKPETPKVGVAVFIEKAGKILMMFRDGSHCAGTWSLPGGHMEIGETSLETCRREIKEEIGIKIDNIEKADFENTIFFDEGLHYITLYYKAIWDETQELKNMEPEKCKELRWVDAENPPNPVFSDLSKKVIVKYGEKQRDYEEKTWKELYFERG